MKITPYTNLEPLLTGVQGKIQDAMEFAVQQVAAQHGMGVRGAQGYNVAVHAGLNVISDEIINVLSEMKKFQLNRKQWEPIRERCRLFVEIQHKAVLRVAADRTHFKTNTSINNNQVNLWLENTYGSINNFIDTEIASSKKEKWDKWEGRLWDILKDVFKFSIGIIIGYIGGRLTGS